MAWLAAPAAAAIGSLGSAATGAASLAGASLSAAAPGALGAGLGAGALAPTAVGAATGAGSLASAGAGVGSLGSLASLGAGASGLAPDTAFQGFGNSVKTIGSNLATGLVDAKTGGAFSNAGLAKGAPTGEKFGRFLANLAEQRTRHLNPANRVADELARAKRLRNFEWNV